MSNYLKEAFKALDLLDSENDLILEGRSFSLDNTGIEDFMNYMNLDDITVADIDVVDPSAETEEDLKATYVGDTILECVACHNLSYCNPTEVEIDEEAGVANMFVECPVCLSNEGYKIVGTVAPYEDVDVSTTGEAEDVKVEIDGSSAADIEVTETKVEKGKEATNSVDVGKTLRKSFGGRFTEGHNNKAKGRRYHISRNDNEEALEVSQKHPVDVTKSEAGKLKESSDSKKAKAFLANKKRHLGTNGKEEAIEDSQKFPVEGTKQEDPKARYKKHLGTNKKGEDIEACQKNPVDVTKSEAGRLSEDRKERLEKAKAKRHHISKNDNEEALEVSQKSPVNVTKAPAGELKEAKKRHHISNKEEEEALEASQKNPVDVTKTKAGKLSESKKEQIKARLKKRHTGNNENEENLEDSQRYPVESPQAAQTGLKEAKVKVEKNLNEGIFKSSLMFTVDLKADDLLNNITDTLAKRLSGEVTSSSRSRARIAIKKDVQSYKTTKQLEDYVKRVLNSITLVVKEYNRKAKQQNAEKIDGIDIEIQLSVDASLFKRGKASGAQQMKLYSCYLGTQTLGVQDRYGNKGTAYNSIKPQDEDSRIDEVSSKLKGIFESLTEGMEDISITTDGEVIKIKSTPRADKEMIVPPQEEPKKQEVEEETPVVSEEGETAEIEVEEIDEETFDTLGESFLKKTYRNIDSFKTSSAKKADNALVLEGIITFKSGKKAKTRFMFEAATTTRKGNVRFVGLNEHIAKKKGSFKLDASIKDGKLVCESLNYNYTGKDARTGKSQRLYGTLRNR